MSNDADNSGAVSTERPSGEAGGKRRGGPPFGSQNARKHGLYAADAGRIDMRTREDRAVFMTVQAIEQDLGGPETVSSQKRVILDGIGRKLRDLFKLENYLGSGVSIINRRRRCLIPAVLEKHRILESIARDLERIGLERQPKPVQSLADYIAEFDARKAENAAKDGGES